MEEEEEIVRIPAERIGVLVGEGGKNKAMLEKGCNIKLTVTSDGEVTIKGESTDVFFARDVVLAIGRGFEPSIAMALTKHDHALYIFHLKEYLSSDKAITRIKGRVIGENGRMKAEIENATGSFISVYGNTIGVISRIDSLEYAKKAIEMLIGGAKHSTVYAYLAKVKRRIFEERIRGL
jgi:ribosomal RNA assembly protein